MKLGAMLSLVVMACFLSGWVHAAAPEQAPQTFVFVGELVSVQEIPIPPCPMGLDGKTRVVCIQVDVLFRARYRVLQRLKGDYVGSTITFTVADHYGFPDFAKFQNGLLFVVLDPDEPYLLRYRGYPVHHTADSDWAFCGDPSNPDEGKPSLASVRPMRFALDAGIAADRSESGIREEFRAIDFDIDDGQIRCKRGVLLDDLYDYVDQRIHGQT